MKTASIESIVSIKPHPNTERLELATVLGWQCVVKKGEFKPGDQIVFVPIDTILPKEPWTEFLGDKLRVRTIKLRGEYSQGIVFPTSILPGGRVWHEGSDVGCELGVKKYEKEIPLALSGTQRGNFPSYLAPKTDEDNGLSNPRLVEAVLANPCFSTLKLDGSSCTVIVQDNEIKHVCSRNVDLVEDPGNAFWYAARKINWIDMPGQWVVQGELMGPGIQGNQLGLSEPTLFVFQVKWPCGKWTTNGVGLPNEVPFLGPAPSTIAECQEMADRQVLPSGKPAEGIVIRPVGMPASGIGRPLGFKIINRNYGE